MCSACSSVWLNQSSDTLVIDENAFGALISYVGIEDDEYEHNDTAAFAERIVQLRDVCTQVLESSAPAPNTHAVFWGHALYVEFAEPEGKPSLLAFIRTLREKLQQHSIETAGIVTFGGRWVETEDRVELSLNERNGVRIAGVSMPSEPLRKALYAETACQGFDGAEGWGTGLFFDVDALEPLGLNLKNQPTPLYVADATFVRVGK
jgi:hypothetical protein